MARDTSPEKLVRPVAETRAASVGSLALPCAVTVRHQVMIVTFRSRARDTDSPVASFTPRKSPAPPITADDWCNPPLHVGAGLFMPRTAPMSPVASGAA